MAKAKKRIYSLILNQPWAMRKDVLDQAVKMLNLTMPEFQAAAGGFSAAEEAGVAVVNGSAVIDMIGPITRYANCLSDIYGYATVEATMGALDAAAADPAVKKIVLNINSPGGSVDGISELATKVKSIKASKPVFAYVGGMACSAAYWIAAQCSEIIINDTAAVGSIGVYAAIEDDTRAMKEAGVDRYMIVSSQSPNKVPDPATEEGKSLIQKEVDALAELFIQAVASGRGVRVQTVMDKFGQGDTFLGADAVKRGMADKVGVFEDALGAVAGTAGRVFLAENASILAAESGQEVLNSENSGGTAEPEKIEEDEFMDLEKLKAEHPDVYKAAVAEGAAAERERILALDDLEARDHLDIIKDAKATGKTAEQAVMAIYKAQKDKQKTISAQRVADAADIPAVASTPSEPGDPVAAEVNKILAANGIGQKGVK